MRLLGLGGGASPYFALSYDGYNPNLGELHDFGAQAQWNVVDSVSLSVGHHQYRFGLDYRRLNSIAIPTNPSVSYYYLSESAVQTNSATTFTQVTAPAYPLYKNFSAFAQDEWRVSQRLNLSLGLRWEVNPAPGVTQGLKPYALQGSNPNTWALAPEGTPLWKTVWYNLAPRLGLAYILHDAPAWETVVRGGGGIFFDTGQQFGSLGFGGPGFVAFGAFAPGGSFPVLPPIPTIVNPPVPPYGLSPAVVYPHLQLPYTVQWNTSFEQAMGGSEVLTVSFIGAHASRLLQRSSVSAPSNPNASSFAVIENGLTSDYAALQAQFRRRMSRRLTVLASYTWSHCLDYGSQDFLLEYQRGSCDFDVRHNASVALSYDLPNVGQNHILKAMLANWGGDDRFTVRTAFPVTMEGAQLFDPTGMEYSAGLNLVQGEPIYLYGENCDSILQGLGDLDPGKGCPGGRAINPLAFTSITSGLGDAPRNLARGFGAWQMDLAIRRNFPIGERVKLQFRAEAFNVFNHPNFGNINSQFGQNTFGQATATLANSLGVLSPLYQMGGPRSMQFSLKLVF